MLSLPEDLYMHNIPCVFDAEEKLKYCILLVKVDSYMKKIFSCFIAGVSCCLNVFLFTSCNKEVTTPDDTKYLQEFHLVNFEPNERLLQDDKLNLFVDYSTCNALGQNSPFFQDVAASLVNRTSAYYSIKGSRIEQEYGDVYTLLRNIEEVNYAELAKAAQMMADGDCESVMITDGEYYTPSIAAGHDNDPYLADAFKKWILRGYDIHVVSEPYIEPYNGRNYHKKRFYILFTDDRMQNNIYERIRRTVDFTDFPEVDEFHISASHPKLKGNADNCSIQDETLDSKSKGFGTFEIEDWDGCDWQTIEDELVNAVDENTGEPLSKGTAIIQMGIDKNSFGCYRIKSMNLNVYDINQEYYDFYEAKVNHEKTGRQEYNLALIENFMQIDNKEFETHSKINISFNRDWFDPSVLTGRPFNYFKIDLAIGDVQSVFDQHEDKFEFESIARNGMKNVSVASSIKQCLADDKVLDKMRGQIIYTIYVKSEAK